MSDSNLRSRFCSPRELRFVLVFSVVALVITSIPYVLGATLATESRIFGGFVYAVEDGYSYLAKMRQGAEGSWLFHIAYTPEPHIGTLFFPFHLLLGKVAALLPGPKNNLTARMVWVYHGARVVFGLGLLLTVYRFLASFTEDLAVRRLAWLMVTFGGGLGWLLVALGHPDWLGSTPLDFILPEGFTFLVLYAFPHIALARSLLLWGMLFLLRAWEECLSRSNFGGVRHAHVPNGAAPGGAGSSNLYLLRLKSGVLNPKSEVRSLDHASRNTQHATRITHHAALAGGVWLLMGLIVPFYVAVAWVVTGAAWVALGLRAGPAVRRPWPTAGLHCEGTLVAGVAGLAVLISAPIVAYSAWAFTSDPVYATWAAQNRILSPHPLHYLAAYGVLLVLAAFAARDAWREEGRGWFPLAWVGVAPVLVYLPFNLQRRLVEGVQLPLSLLAALGVSSFRLQGSRLRVVVTVLLVGLSLTNVLLVAGNCLVLRGQPAPIYRDAGEVAALDWLSERVESDDVVLAAYETGNYLPVRVGARTFVGHGPESIRADEKKALVALFFAEATDDVWRCDLLSEYGVDWVFWGPAERGLGTFDLRAASYLRRVYEAGGYILFEVEQ